MLPYVFKFKDNLDESKEYFLDNIKHWFIKYRNGLPSTMVLNKYIRDFENGVLVYRLPDDCCRFLRTFTCWESIVRGDKVINKLDNGSNHYRNLKIGNLKIGNL